MLSRTAGTPGSEDLICKGDVKKNYICMYVRVCVSECETRCNTNNLDYRSRGYCS